MRRMQFMLSAIFVIVISLTFMSVSAQVPPSAETLVVYSGRSEGLIGPLLTQFTADTGIQIEVRYGSTAEMAATILEEGENSPADVYIAQDAGALGALSEAGLLLPLSPDILNQVEAPYRSNDGLWVGLSGRARVLVYNTELISEDELPASILDLTGPEWAGRLAWAPSNASLQAHVTAMRVALGEDAARAWVEGIIANDAVVFEGNSPIVEAVAAGEIAAGLVNHYYLYNFRKENPDAPVENYFFPDGDLGSLINIAGAGIVSSSDQQGLSQRLLLYLLSADAQTYFAQETSEYPLAIGAEPSSGIPPFAEIEAPEFDLNDLKDLEATLTLLQDTGALP